MFPIRPAEAQIALEAWTRKNRGFDDFDQPTRVTPEEFKDLFTLLQAAKPLEEMGGLPFAIVAVEIEESKSDMRTGAARVRLSVPRLLTEKELGFSDNQG
jgi:hypothetical protein